MSDEEKVPPMWTPPRKRRRNERVLPPLPESATRLAQEIHERAQRALAEKLATVEAQVRSCVDQAIQKAVGAAIGMSDPWGRLDPNGKVGKAIQAAAEGRISSAVSAAVEVYFAGAPLGELLGKDELDKIRARIRAEMANAVEVQARKLAEQLVAPAAERLAQEALEQLQAYYGAAKLVAAEGKGNGDAE